MNILCLVTDGFGGFGGIAAYNRHLLRALSEAGHSVTVLPSNGGDVAPEGIRQLSPKSSKMAYTLAVLRIMIMPKGYDLIWCGHIGLAPLARVAAMRFRCPWWLQIHGIDAWERPGRVKRWAVRTAALVTAVSRYTRRRYLAWAPVAPETVRVVPDTVDEDFSPGPKPDYLLKRYRLEGNFVMLTVGRISAAENYKGHDRIIRLLPELLETDPNVVYVVAGDGDGRPALEQLASSIGVGHACRFIGKVGIDDLVDHYRMADLFVMPSTGEGFGIVYLEAMACGIPALGLDCDGSLDPLQAGSLGIPVSPGQLLGAIRTQVSRSREDSTPKIEIDCFREGCFREQIWRLAATFQVQTHDG